VVAATLAETGPADAAARAFRRLADRTGEPGARFAAGRAAARGRDLEAALASFDAVVAAGEATDDLRLDASWNAALLATWRGDVVGARRRLRAVVREGGAREREARVALARLETPPRILRLLRPVTGEDDLAAQARWMAAEAARELGDRRREIAELRALATRTENAPATSWRAERGAAALFRLAASTERGAVANDLELPRANLAQYSRAVARVAERELARAEELARSYDAVVRRRQAAWTEAAWRAQGRIYEDAASAIARLPFALPRDLRRRITPLDRAGREQVTFEAEAAIRGALEEHVAPLECLAVERHLLALQLARRASLDPRPAQRALSAHGMERIAACDLELGVDLSAGDLRVVPEGQTLEATDAPPALTR